MTCLAAIVCGIGCTGVDVVNEILPMPVLGWVVPTPDFYGLPYENVRISIDANESIHGWFIPADGARGTMLIHHGAFFNRSFYSPQITLFHELDLNVMIVDYQGFGESIKPARIDTVLPDANAALQDLQLRDDPGTDRIVIYGVSMGTLPALAQAAESPAGVVGVIVEGVVQEETLIPFGFELMGIPATPDAFTRVAADLDPSRTVPGIGLPKLFIHSIEDAMTPYEGAVQLYNLAPEPKQLAPVVGFHGLSIVEDPTYSDQLDAFLTQLLD